MHCPKCGVEVIEQAGFCHKCGEKLDLTQRQFPPRDPAETAPMAEDVSYDEGAPTEPAEKFKQAVAPRDDVEEEPEAELWRGGYSSKAMIGRWMLSAVITVALPILAFWAGKSWLWWSVLIAVSGLWLYQCITLCYRRMNIRYQLTTQRFMHETGILRRVTDRIEIIDIDDIAFEQSFLERFVGIGTIRISSSDRTHPELVMPGIENVKEVAGKIDEKRRSERRRRGLHIESI